MTDSGVATGTVIADLPAPGVRRLRIEHPERRGALSRDVLSSLELALAQTPSDTRCLILTGTGETFCAGYDLRALGSPPDPAHADATIAPDAVEVLTALERQPLPVVAALNGPALGGGMELALACDIRLAVADAAMGAPAGRLGLVYSPGGLERIAAELPFAIAADLFVGGATLSAARCCELGLVSRIVEPDALQRAAVEAAVGITQLAPQSVQANRRALRALRRSGATFTDAARDRLEADRARGMRSEDFAEGVAAFRDHRPPRFTGR